MANRMKCESEDESLESSDGILNPGGNNIKARQLQKESILMKFLHPVQIFIYHNVPFFTEDFRSFFDRFPNTQQDQAQDILNSMVKQAVKKEYLKQKTKFV